MSYKLLIASEDGEQYRTLIGQEEPDLEIAVYDGGAESEAFAREADILLVWRFPPDLVSRMPRLRWIQSTGAGVDPVMAARPLPKGVVVTRMVDVFSPAMAEYVLGYALAVTLRIPRVLEAQREKRWAQFNAPLLRDRTAVVVGLGSIGREVCRLLGAVGVRVIGVSRSGRAIAEASRVEPVERIDEVLPLADFLVLVLPLTDESRGLIDRRRLALLPRHAWLINVGRGALIREDELIASLQAGEIGGAVLDVFEREPLPPESPLWSMENVIVTPHIAGPDDVRVIATRFLENFRRFRAGEPLVGVVDVERGY